MQRLSEILGHFLDLTEPECVEIEIQRDGKVVWINVNGLCRLRACKIKDLKLIDNRSDRK